MKQYTHLSLDEREKLYIMKNNGESLRNIGKTLNRCHTSLSRELRRNISSNNNLGYLPDTADKLAGSRKAKHGGKISRYPELKCLIINKIKDDRYSPEMIAGKLKNEQVSVRISHETIYKYIYSQEGQELELYQHLMCRRPKRNQKYGRKTRGNHGIPNRVSISQRPAISKDEFGHFEADLTFFTGSGKINLLTMVERKTGFFLAHLNKSKDSENIAVKLLDSLIKFPKKHRKTITFDNGKEFVLHDKIREITGTPTYFCHPGSPWEKPYVETSHALLHRFIPKKTNSKTLTQTKVQYAITKLNNLPRKRFNFKTPAEMLEKEYIYQLGALRA